MEWRQYAGALRRRWWIIAVVLILDIIGSGVVYARDVRHLGYQACTTLYVADASAPTEVAVSSDLGAAGELLAGESAANFFADDIVDVAESQHVAAYVTARIHSRALPNSAAGDINGSISGSRRDRTVQLCVNNPDQNTALAAAQAAGTAMTAARSKFVGPLVAKRTYVTVISDASVAKVSSRHELVNLALRIFLGFLVAIGLAFLWDFLAMPPAADERMRPRAVS